MKKRILAIFVMLVLLMGLFPALPVSAAVEDGSYYDGCYYFSVYDGEATILSYESNHTEADAPAVIEVPSTLGGCPVTTIGYEAFTDCIAGKLILPDTVKTIGAYAFYRNEDIGTIVLPDTLDVVGTYAFYGTNMEDVFYFPTVTQSVGYYAFGFIQCDTVVLPSSMETISANILANAYNESIVIPASVKTVEADAFWSAGSLKHAFFLGTAEELAAITVYGGNDRLTDHLHCAVAGSREAACGQFGYTGYACTECDAICAITRTDKSHHVYADGVCFVCSHAVADDWSIEEIAGGIKLTAYNGTDTVVEIPSSIGKKTVVALDDNLFKNRSELEGITLPETITSIGSYTFYNCKKLTKLNLPEGITAIEPYTFYNCAELSDIRIPSKVTKIGEYAFYGCKKAAELKVPATLTEAGRCAFMNSGLSEAVIPQAFTSIPAQMFCQCANLTAVTLPSGLKRIENAAFSGSGLVSVEFPSSLEYIGENAFENVTALKKIVIPNSVTELGKGAFRGNPALSDVTLPNGITTLPDRLFWYTNLKNFEIPDTVIHIGQTAIHLAAGETVKLPASVQTVAGNFVCASSANNYDNHGLDFTVTVDAANPYLKATEYGVFSKDGKILYAGFIADPNQKMIRIPDGVETVSAYTYDNWYNGDYAKTLVLPASVTSVGYDAFDIMYEGEIWYLGTEEQWNAISFDEGMGNDLAWNIENGELSLHYATVSAATATCEIASATQYSCSVCPSILLTDQVAGEGHSFGADELCSVCNEANTEWVYTVNEEQATITGCFAVEEFLILPQKLGGYPVTATEGELLMDWEQKTTVKTVRLPSTLKVLGDYSFSYAYSIAQINLPEGLEKIGSIALAGTSLSSVDLPQSLREIGDNAFSNCSLLEAEIRDDITYGHSVYGGNPIRSATVSGHFTVVDSWFADCVYLETVTLPSSITEIGDMAFHGCRALRNINIPTGVVRLGSSSFSGCEALTELELPSGLQIIGGSAFYECKNLQSLTIPAGVTKIESSAFSGCKSLETLTIPANATVSTDYLFENCTSLKSVTLPQNLTKIGSSMFRNCTQLTAFTVPDGVGSIESRAFAGSKVTALYLPSSVSGVDSSAFAYEDWARVTVTIDDENPYLKIENEAILSASGETFYRYLGNAERYVVPAGVKTIESEAFRAASLKELILPDGLTTIWSQFIADTAITEITIPSSVSRMGHTFWDANALRLIVLEDGLESISGYGMFQYCNADVIVPKSVTEIEDWFEDCYGRILYLGTPEDRESITFDGNDERTLSLWHYVAAESYRAPSCTADGARIYTCTDPAETLEVKIPAAHQFSGNFCSVCGACRAYSAHPYAANTDESKTLTQPGATWMALTFSEETYVEAGSDFIELYDGNGNLLGRYTGAELSGKRIELETDTVTVRLLADGDTQGYGYQVEALDAGVRLTAESGAKLNAEVGAVDPDAVLVAEEFEPAEEIVLPEGSGDAVHFEIHIEKDNEEIQPDGTVSISLPIPDGMDGADCAVYRVEENGELTDMNASVDEEGNLTFETDHFSHYVLVEMAKVIDTAQVVAILQYLNGNGIADPAWDRNADGKISLADALNLLKTLSA